MSKTYNGIDKISKYGNVAFAVMLYTAFVISIGMFIGDYVTKIYQFERLNMKLSYNLTCFDKKDINHIITGQYEFLK
jgi:ABC-type enterochelin transport system permease subunit